MTDNSQFIQIIRHGMDLFAHRSMRDWSHFVKSTGMSMPQFGILMHLHYHGTCGVSDISGRMDVSNAAASQLIEKLVRAGMIERTEDPSDRRAKLINLSDQGQELIKTGIAERYRWVNAMAEGLENEQRKKVAEAMQVLIEALQHMQEQEQLSIEQSH